MYVLVNYLFCDFILVPHPLVHRLLFFDLQEKSCQEMAIPGKKIQDIYSIWVLKSRRVLLIKVLGCDDETIS